MLEYGVTLDDLFRRAGVRNPDGPALADPPDRARFTDGPPRRLSYAEADRAISAIAARLRGLGLAADEVVAIQLLGVDGLKNEVELGNWLSWRTFIGEAGDWQAFVAGD